MRITKKISYSDTYNHTYPSYNAPMVDVQTYLPPFHESKVNNTNKVRFCLDTGADEYAAIPERILLKTGINSGQEVRVEDFSGTKHDKSIYIIGLSIKELNFHQEIEAISTQKDFGLLPRRVLNDWEIILDGPNGSFSITTDY
jgi:predicted aspartyl protease